jgi:putative chitinase
MNTEQLAKILKMKPAKAGEWIDAINETFEKFDISTPERQACFLGQCAHESGGFTALSENLNYSAASLCRVWPKRFPTLGDGQNCERNPEKIANKVYASRMGNGDEESGEGYAYRGRGLIQLTGKSNYQACGEALGVDLVENPDLVATPQYAALSAGWFWNKNKLNNYADKGDMEGLTKKINGGTHGIEDRVARTQAAIDVLMA